MQVAFSITSKLEDGHSYQAPETTVYSEQYNYMHSYHSVASWPVIYPPHSVNWHYSGSVFDSQLVLQVASTVVKPHCND